MSETEFMNLVLDKINSTEGFFAWRNNSTGVYDAGKEVFRKGGRFAIKGVSDILGVYSGNIIAIEVKAPKTKKYEPNPEQGAFIRKINRHGGFAICVNDMQTVELFLQYIMIRLSQGE